jgi:hypothetical protein
MGLWDVYSGNQTWSDYVSTQEQITGFEKAVQKQTKALINSRSGELQITLNQHSYEVALEQGLGAVSANMLEGTDAITNSIDFGFEQVASGIDKLNADFNLLIGDVTWKLETQTNHLASILTALHSPLDTQAKELRQRAEYAYQNGWYEEALKDFLDAEQKNYQDFAVHRSIGNIYLYHSIDLPKALDYFRRASKYARPRDTRQAAEAEYFSAIVCFLQKDTNQALSHMREATELNSRLYDAFYMHACFAAVIGNGADALSSLERAIQGDARYFERAKNDRLLDNLRSKIQLLFDRLFQESQNKALAGKQVVDALYARIESLLPEDQVKLQKEYEKVETLFLKPSYRDKRFFAEAVFPSFQECFHTAEQRKQQADIEDRRIAEQRRSQEESDHARQQQLFREERERKYADRMRAAKNWFTSSIRYSITFYFLVGFVGCYRRVLNRENFEGGLSAPLRSYTNEAWFVAEAIFAIGIVGSILLVIHAQSKR